MRTRYFTRKGKFNWRCLLGHKWGAWSKPMIRTLRAGIFLGDDVVWKERKCERCGELEGEAIL